VRVSFGERRAQVDKAELIEVWRAMLGGIGGAWVLFENGTCVTLADPGADPAAKAMAILRESGPTGIQSAVADFAGTIEVPDGSGWVVASRHADINTFVGRGEVAPGTPDEAVGRLGSSKRAQDTEQLRVLNVEDKRYARTKPFAKRTSRPQLSGFSFSHPGGDCVVWYAHHGDQILDMVIAPRATFAACFEAGRCRLRVGEAEVAFGSTHKAYIFEAGGWRIVAVDGLRGSELPHVTQLDGCGSTGEIARKILGR
jgi:hypothetical protein